MDGSVSPPAAKRRCLGHTTPTDPSTLRIFSWNINGIQPFLQPSIESFIKRSVKGEEQAIPTSLRNFLRRHDWPQILNLQEVKISPSDNKTKRSVQSAVNSCRRSGSDDGPSYVVRFCLPKDKYNATGFGRKVYGVACIIREDFFQREVECVREVDWDLEGRVLVIETKSKLSIWNIYAVNGTIAPYKDSLTGKVTGTRHDRKLAFHRLLVEEGRRLEQEGYRLVLTGDLNVARAPIDGHPQLRTVPEQHVRNRQDFNAKLFTDSDGLQLVDSFRELYPDRKLYSWMSRNRPWLESCDRVDYMLVSSTLRDDVAGADILMTPQDRGPSDHFPVFLELKSL